MYNFYLRSQSECVCRKQKIVPMSFFRDVSTSLLQLAKESTRITSTTSASLALFLCIRDTLILKLSQCRKITTLDYFKTIWDLDDTFLI